MHAVQLELIRKPDGGVKAPFRYSVTYNGETLIKASGDPEFDACRELVKRGVTGKLATYRGPMPCMVMDIERAARFKTGTNGQGTPVFVKVASVTPTAAEASAGTSIPGRIVSPATGQISQSKNEISMKLAA
jgi:hypothetical protein